MELSICRVKEKECWLISKKNESDREYGMHRSNKKCKQSFSCDAECLVDFAGAT
jgi:hypothetical protein